MITTCPKCGYVRQPQDTAPEYQCPQCQVIYEKYMLHQKRVAEELEKKAKSKPKLGHHKEHTQVAAVSLFHKIVVLVGFAVLIETILGLSTLINDNLTIEIVSKVPDFIWNFVGQWFGLEEGWGRLLGIICGLIIAGGVIYWSKLWSRIPDAKVVIYVLLAGIITYFIGITRLLPYRPIVDIYLPSLFIILGSICILVTIVMLLIKSEPTLIEED